MQARCRRSCASPNARLAMSEEAEASQRAAPRIFADSAFHESNPSSRAIVA